MTGRFGGLKNAMRRVKALCAKQRQLTLHATRFEREFSLALRALVEAIPPAYRCRAVEAYGSKGDTDSALGWWMDASVWPDARPVPAAVPAVLLDVLLANPGAESNGCECGACGLVIPESPSEGQVGTASFKYRAPLFAACPACGGSVGYCLYTKKVNPDMQPRVFWRFTTE